MSIKKALYAQRFQVSLILVQCPCSAVGVTCILSYTSQKTTSYMHIAICTHTRGRRLLVTKHTRRVKAPTAARMAQLHRLPNIQIHSHPRPLSPVNPFFHEHKPTLASRCSCRALFCPPYSIVQKPLFAGWNHLRCKPCECLWWLWQREVQLIRGSQVVMFISFFRKFWAPLHHRPILQNKQGIFRCSTTSKVPETTLQELNTT